MTTKVPVEKSIKKDFVPAFGASSVFPIDSNVVSFSFGAPVFGAPQQTTKPFDSFYNCVNKNKKKVLDTIYDVLVKSTDSSIFIFDEITEEFCGTYNPNTKKVTSNELYLFVFVDYTNHLSEQQKEYIKNMSIYQHKNGNISFRFTLN